MGDGVSVSEVVLLVPLLVVPGLCSALLLAIKIRFLATVASVLEVAVPWYKISQMSSNVNDDFSPSFLPNMLTWGAKVMVWTLQSD